MATPQLNYSRKLTPAFFVGASHEDLKWTINYLVGLLDSPEEKTGKEEKMSFDDAKAFLNKHRLSCRAVPADFNGMRDEVNPKYL